ncbi:acyltransferase [Micromonospora sp. C51]|uniref:acyltransferase family protein n=1 Tax=Micromonospora sp. C51 TaxID=2824879 RepID=UPI001B37DD98|nr:acyltransferase [Micromonospora sp. C51]MBQ1049129.1 acyltransferase [Micromonospora sp. C51]
MTQTDARPHRLPALTGYRFFLALTVAAVHLLSTSQLFANEALQLGMGLTTPLASAALATFFTLSGFVLTWSAPAMDRAIRFWRRRFWKIVPLHVLAWGVAVAFVLVASAPSPVSGFSTDLRAGPAVASLLLVQGWVPSWDYLSYLNAPAWSISTEAFFYLLFPLLLPLVLRIPAERLWRWCFAIIGGILLISALSPMLPGVAQLDWLPFNLTEYWFVYTFPPVRLLNFLLGMVLARIVQTGRWRRVARWKLVLSTILAFLLTPMLPFTFIFSAALFLSLFALVANLAHADLEGRGRVLRSRPLVALGNASYALYIIHFPIMLIMRHLVGADQRFGAGAGLLIAGAMLLVSIAVAIGLHRWVEEPLRRRYARARITGDRPSLGGQVRPATVVPGQA